MIPPARKRLTSWKQFASKVRSRGCSLLSELDKFDNPILITGCQRSGTTMLTRIIFQSNNMVNYWQGKDDELDAAQILSGYIPSPIPGRYCFQTTYLNQCYKEYFDHLGTFKMVWVLRNPYSVVFSILYNWRRFARNELFMACGADFLPQQDKIRYERFGHLAISRIEKACYSYVGKSNQLYELLKRISPEHIAVVDYDLLTHSKHVLIPKLFSFLELEYRNEDINKIHTKSTSKADKLSRREKELVESICSPVYRDLTNLISIK